MQELYSLSLYVIYVIFCGIGIVAATIVMFSTTELSYLIMQSTAVRTVERNYFKKCGRFLRGSLLTCVICVISMEILRPADTNQGLLLAIIIATFELGFGIGICSPFLNEQKRMVRKNHLFY